MEYRMFVLCITTIKRRYLTDNVMKEKGINIKKVDTFKNYKPVRISQELFQVNRCRWRMSVPAYRLLFALAQSLDYTQKDLFPELGFELNTIFKYLGLDNNKDKYARLQEALIEVRKEGLDIVTPTKNGGVRYSGYSWITSYSFTTDDKLLHIRINDDVKPFLLDLKQYALIQPKYYLKLSTEYQNWFYPYLKNVVKLGKWRIAIEDLKHALYLEKTPSYDSKQNKNATEYFLNRVIGIQVSTKAKNENQAATAAKRKPKFIEWDYTKDKEGNIIGTLAGITANTDINVTASVEKTGRSYTHIIFYLSEKQHKNIINTDVEDDMGKPQQRAKRKKITLQMGDIFAENLDINPAYEKIPQARIQIYTNEQVLHNAKELNMSVAVFLDKMRLQKMEDGRYYKEY